MRMPNTSNSPILTHTYVQLILVVNWEWRNSALESNCAHCVLVYLVEELKMIFNVRKEPESINSLSFCESLT